MLTKKFKFLALCITLVATISFVAHAKMTLLVQTSGQSEGFHLKYINENWASKLSEMTSGEIQIKLMPIDSIMPRTETPEAVIAGVLSGDLTSVAYFSGRNPAFAILGDLIAAYDSPAQVLNFCRNAGGAEALQELWDKTLPDKIHVVGCGAASKESLVSKVPILGVDDLKGLKIRSPEGLAASIFRAVGATPVNISYADVFSALKEGIVDLADASAYANNDQNGLTQVAPYSLYPGVHSISVNQFTISKKIWEKMEPKHQKALIDWYYMLYEDLLKATYAEDQKLVARDRADPNRTIIDWPQEERERLRKIAMQIWEETANRTPEARKALDIQYQYMKEIGILK